MAGTQLQTLSGSEFGANDYRPPQDPRDPRAVHTYEYKEWPKVIYQAVAHEREQEVELPNGRVKLRIVRTVELKTLTLQSNDHAKEVFAELGGSPSEWFEGPAEAQEALRVKLAAQDETPATAPSAKPALPVPLEVPVK